MAKVIAAINMTIDGICDHTVGIPDEALHQHYANLLDNGAVALYGRTTYQLMQFWQTLLDKPSGEKAMDDFAKSIDRIPKIVFSNTMQNTEWKTAILASNDLETTVLKLKQQHTKDILIGSRSLIIQLLNHRLIDEFQLCIHPLLEGKGLPLFNQITDRIYFKLNNTKVFDSGAIVLYYNLDVSSIS